MKSETEDETNQIKKFLRKWKVDKEQGLLKIKHEQYAKWVIHHLGPHVIHFQNAQPWIHYYTIHTINMMGASLTQLETNSMIKALKYCFSEGFGGGYNQLPHLAPTYAGFLAALELGPVAYPLLNRQELYSFFRKVKQGGRFVMHQQGECDLRASYIVILITKSLRLPEDLLEGVADVILQSQTHEGGISNVIGGQAHGGFTFCGVAALALLGRLQDLDISRLMEWLSQRQVQFGGFNGRTNKLIDSCYSFWVGAVFNIVNDYFKGTVSVGEHLLYAERDLQEYILFYCQDVAKGGLWDKPGKGRDIYHTAYALSGLSLSKQLSGTINQATIQRINPLYNITDSSYLEASKWFSSLTAL